jgi:hypothetical protein
MLYDWQNSLHLLYALIGEAATVVKWYLKVSSAVFGLKMVHLTNAKNSCDFMTRRLNDRSNYILSQFCPTRLHLLVLRCGLSTVGCSSSDAPLLT